MAFFSLPPQHSLGPAHVVVILCEDILLQLPHQSLDLGSWLCFFVCEFWAGDNGDCALSDLYILTTDIATYCEAFGLFFAVVSHLAREDCTVEKNRNLHMTTQSCLLVLWTGCMTMTQCGAFLDGRSSHWEARCCPTFLCCGLPLSIPDFLCAHTVANPTIPLQSPLCTNSFTQPALVASRRETAQARCGQDDEEEEEEDSMESLVAKLAFHIAEREAAEKEIELHEVI